MSEIIVGEIEEFDVIYVPEKDVLFCKNTTIPYKRIKKAVDSNIDKEELKSNLTMYIDRGSVQLGCLTTTLENIKQIDLNIKKVRKQNGEFIKNKD